MPVKNLNFIKILGFFILLYSFTMIAANRYWLGFPGIFYFQPALASLVFIILMIRMGLKIYFDSIEDSTPWKMLHETNIYVLIIVMIVFSAGAVQYTPFKTIDKQILMIEHYLHLDLKAVIAWTNSSELVKFIAHTAYTSIEGQIIFLPILVILARKYEVIYEFYFLLLATWIIGSSIYYFFPTTGPASIIDSPYFDLTQRATGLKFWQLHHYIQPSTVEGGLIAMPSFHVIWGWLFVYLLRPWPIACGLLLIVNLTMVASCVLLGWHYFLDIVGSIFTVLTAHSLYYYFHKSWSSNKAGCKKTHAALSISSDHSTNQHLL